MLFKNTFDKIIENIKKYTRSIVCSKFINFITAWMSLIFFLIQQKSKKACKSVAFDKNLDMY